VDEYRVRPEADVLEELDAAGGGAYTHFDPHLRQLIPNLNEHPIADENDVDNVIYDADGNRVNRRFARVPRGAPTCGVLVRLSSIGTLFEREGHDLRDEAALFDNVPQPHRRRNAGVTIYPQCYFGNLGHVKANSVMRPLEEEIESCNEHIRTTWADYHNEDDEDDEIPAVGAIQPVVEQMYNDSVHSMHTCAGRQETQRGLQTAALASSYEGLSDGNKTKGNGFWRETNAKLPFDRQLGMLSQRADGSDQPKDLRVEAVFVLNLAALPPRARNGA
jgi:hypothetical protein